MILFTQLILWSRRSRIATPAIILLVTTFAIIGNTIGFMFFESASFGDSLWYSIISITTIGYGDFSASTLGARICTVFFIVIVGLAAFSMALGWAVDTYTSLTERSRRGMSPILANNHIVIVNFPNEGRIRQLLRELSVDRHYKDREIVLVTDQVTELPSLEDIGSRQIQFVYGSPLDQGTFKRAQIDKATAAIVLATNYNEPSSSDAYVSSVVLAIEDLNSEVHTVAECLDPIHASLFKASNCDSIVYGLQMATNLLVQEMQDHGVAEVFRMLTCNSEGDTVYSASVDSIGQFEPSYSAIAKALLEEGANLIAVTRQDTHYTTFGNLHPELKDTLIFASKHRYFWKELRQLTVAVKPQKAL